jgi:hypothetical protein
MKIEFEIPDELAEYLQAHYSDLSRAALEALALEGYRMGLLSDGQVRMLLGLSTRIKVHEFLKEHRVYLNYSLADLEQDIQSSKEIEQGRIIGSTHAA